jgi:hypothetical protein
MQTYIGAFSEVQTEVQAATAVSESNCSNTVCSLIGLNAAVTSSCRLELHDLPPSAARFTQYESVSLQKSSNIDLPIYNSSCHEQGSDSYIQLYQ